MKQLQDKARELLESGQVKVVIGYGEGAVPGRTMPVFITKPENVGKLIWNNRCFNNLTFYLTKDDVRALGKPAVVVKGCDARAIVVLVKEEQVKREDVVIIGMTCEGQGEPQWGICQFCDVHTPRIYDYLIGNEISNDPKSNDKYAALKELEGKTPAERWQWWQERLSRCIRCYACRNACPLCYCDQCIADKAMPRWVPSSAHGKGNFSWNVIRAMHLAGRCISCGACERACPMKIPIGLLNRKLAKEIEENFGFVPGYRPDEELPMRSFRQNDVNEFFR